MPGQNDINFRENYYREAAKRFQGEDPKIRGYTIVMIGMIMGAAQALLTIPLGGGIACFIVSGGIIGALGMVVMGMKNNFEDRVKKGAYIGAVIFVIAFVLSSYQAAVLRGEIDSNIEKLGEVNDEMDDDSYEEDKKEFIERSNRFISHATVFILLLSLTTGLIAVAPCLPVLLSKHEKRKIMYIPVIIFVCVIIVVPVITYYIGFQDFKESLDKYENAENEDEEMKSLLEMLSINEGDMILGSQIGGVINLVNLIFVMILFTDYKPPLKKNELGYSDYEQGRSGQMNNQNFYPQGNGQPINQNYYKMGAEQSGFPGNYNRQNEMIGSQGYSSQVRTIPGNQPQVRQGIQQTGSGGKICSRCGRELHFIREYQRFYCYNCRDYD